MSKALDKIKDFRRQTLKELYKQCTPVQQELFDRMYRSVDDISEKNIDWAIQQCERTIAKNEERGVKE